MHYAAGRAERKRASKRAVREMLRQSRTPLPPPPTPPARPHRRRRPPVIAVTGEAVLIDGEQRYVLLCASTGQCLWRSDGLRTADVLAWLLAIRAENPRALIVSYGIDYHVNHWLVSLGADGAADLWHAGECRWASGQYRLAWAPGKHFTVSRRTFIYNPHFHRIRSVTELTATVWDVHGFFQVPLVQALEQWGIGDADARALLVRAAARRGQYTPADRDELQRYCQLYCALLAELFTRAREAVRSLGLRPRRWDGAGALAVALLEQHAVADHKRPGPESDDFEQAVMTAYFGGRVEDFRIGLFRHLYAYDLNSAYPAAAAELPSLRGRWRHVREYDPRHRWALWRVRWRFPPDAGLTPFPVRVSNGAIFYPDDGEGWYWAPEVRAATDAWGIGRPEHTIDVLEGYVFTPDNPHVRPFGWIHHAYEQRRALEAAGEPGAASLLKLALNAIYGKLAQGRGWRGEPPRYQSWIWAGMLCSQVRAEMLLAAWMADDALVAISTDAIYTTAPVDLPISLRMGEWKMRELKDVLWVANGVFCSDVHEPATAARGVKSRGFRPDELNFAELLEGWRSEGIAYHKVVRVRRFVGIGAATHGMGVEHWRQWKEVEIPIDYWPTNKILARGMGARPTAKLQETLTPWVGFGPSVPYRPKLGGRLDIPTGETAEWLLEQEQPG
jgi:hypothetical protein